jgi:hypothetical protein
MVWFAGGHIWKPSWKRANSEIARRRTIVTGVSDAVAEAIVALGIDRSEIETLGDLQTGLRVAMAKMERRIEGEG